MKRPSDYTPEQGLRFEVHLDKARGLHSPDALPFEVKLDITEGAARWTVVPLEDVERVKVITLTRAGLSIREICEETGMSKSKIQRIRKQAETAGELDENAPEDLPISQN